MSERVEKLIAQENDMILRMLHNHEAIYVEAVYELDKDGKRVYDWETMEYDFYTNMGNLIELNKQRGLASLEQQMTTSNEISNVALAKYEHEQDK